MALSGWTKKCQITVAANKITSTETNQVIYFSASHFNSEMLTLGGANACKSDGSDLRFSSDSSGDSLLGAHVVKISLSATPANSVLVVAVRFASITANASFSFYCHWGNASAETPAPLSSSGSGTCWSQFYGVLPLSEDPTLFTTSTQKWKCFKEVTSRFSSGSMVGAPTVGTISAIPGMPSLQVSTLGGVQIPEVSSTAKGGFQFAMICYIDSLATGTFFTESNTAASQGFSINSTGVAVIQYSGDYGVTFADQIGKWGILRVTNTANSYSFKFGTKTATISWTGSFSNLQFISSGSVGVSMKVCGFMINQFAKVADTYFTNILDCINNNATLATAGSIEAVSVSNTLRLTNLRPNTEVRIYRAGTTTELAGTENSTTEFEWGFSNVESVDIAIHNIQYEYIRYENFALTNSDITIPIQQRFDRNFINP